ncbi:MAG: flagellar protein FlgN [Magnetococcales bacterium]|nr:flagellar protein FlgN [Magnetococcales bacterium]
MADSGNDLFAEDLRQLRQILEPLVQQFTLLEGMLRREQEALRRRDVETLESLSSQIAEQLTRIRAIDQLRQRVTTQLGKRLGLPPTGMTLETLDKAMGGKTGLQEIRTQLRQSIHQADAVNRENQAVFTGVLAATDSILAALQGGVSGSSASYNRLGSRRTGSRFNLLSKQL